MSSAFPTITNIIQSLVETPARVFAFLRSPFGPTTLRFDPSVLLRELASMLRSGVSLPEALSFTAEGLKPRARSLVDAVHARVEAGEPLSRALDELPERFAPSTLKATVAAGERSGQLPDLLDEIVAEAERLQALERRIGSFLIYPLVVIAIALGLMSVISSGVFPVYGALYGHLDAPLPLLSRGLWWFGSNLAGWLFLGVVVLLVVHLAGLQRPAGRLPMTGFGRWLANHMPVVRGLRRALIEVRFARTLRTLLDSGVALPEALDLCEGVVADDKAGTEIVAATRRIRDGEAPSQALRDLRFLSPAFMWFLAESERRGDFLEVTRAMAEVAEERFLTRVEVVERLLEPVGTLALGAIVGVLVVGTYEPMFRLIGLVGQ